MTQPTPAQINALAAAIRSADHYRDKDPDLLAENILKHWQPPVIVFDAPKPLAVEGVQALADEIAVFVMGETSASPSESEPVELTDEELLRTYGLAKRDYCYEGPDDDWPNRAERAATICGLRAVLARCGHSVELVTPPPPSTEKLFRELDQLLDGFDRCSDHPKGGWWETEDGVKVGRIKLRELKELITRHLSPPQP